MIVERFKFDTNSFVVEIASNDGCLLKNFKKYNIPVIAIDPTANTAREAERYGVNTIVDFFTLDFAQNKYNGNYPKADLVIGNNVLAHVPDINDFLQGIKHILNEKGIITIEFPSFMNLVKYMQFDTIYHEHFSYLSLFAIENIFKTNGLAVFDVEKLSTHGGSLRIYAKHQENFDIPRSERVSELLLNEIGNGINNLSYYEKFQDKVQKIKYDALTFLIGEKLKGKKIIGYGAASKGNTFINYCGIKGTDLINFVVDTSPYKQNRYLPGSHIPVVEEENIRQFKPDFIIILPWNLKDEISEQLSYVQEWGCRFVIFLPEIIIY